MKAFRKSIKQLTVLSCAFAAGCIGTALYFNNKSAPSYTEAAADVPFDPQVLAVDVPMYNDDALPGGEAGYYDENEGYASADQDLESEADFDSSAASFYAQEFEISDEEAIRRLKREDKLADAMQEIVQAEGDRIAGWGIDHTPEYRGWVSLVGNEAPTAETSRVLSENPDIDLRTDANYSYRELEIAQDQLLSPDQGGPSVDLLPEDLRNGIAYTNIDMKTNTLVVAIDQQAPELQQVMGSPDAMLAYAENHFASMFNVPVQVMLDDPVNPEATFYGGLPIRTCTSAFSVRDTNGRVGILTAGHCGSNQGAGLVFVREKQRQATDAQWHRVSSGNSVRRIFRARPNQTRDLRATMNRGSMPGRFVCHYGKNSGYSCGTVTSIALRPSYVPNATSFVQVRGNSLSSCGGDSGGPWFNGTTAYGIHSGSAGSTGCNGSVNYAIFGSIRTAVNDLNVRLLFN